MNGNAIMFDAVAGKILAVGGAVDYQYAYATTNAHLIVIGAPGTTATVTTLPSMHYPRAFCNSVVLPNGKVMVTGGQTYPIPFSDANATLPAEIYDPVANSWSVVAAISSPRNYHSVALLMPDATVVNGGGGLCGECNSNHFDAEIYRPAYLFTSTGALAIRPSITTVSSTSIKVGGSLTVTVALNGGTAVTGWSLIRIGSNTHSVNTDQRRIALTPTGVSGETYMFTLPSDPGVALPGYWYLFAVNSAGTPSVATIVLIHT
jgi:galactose oxidase